MRVKNKKVVYLLGGALLAILTASSVFAKEDVEGSKDHPLISRYSGSIISWYRVAEFDEYILPLGKLDKAQKWTKSQQLEGKVTQIVYKAPEGRSTLEIYRNYELALKKAGFEILFTVTNKQLEEGWDAFAEAFAAATTRGDGDLHHYHLKHFITEARFLSAKLTRPEGEVYVSLHVVLDGLQNALLVQLDVIEVKPVEIGLVTVDADALVKDIARTGYVAIYGIYFDTGKADLKPESEPTLKEIAKLLQQNPKLNLYVVGHTDSVGGLDFNMELSQRRAEAVAKALVSKYGVPAERLAPYGVGPLSPVASNKTEEGRAKNRRVELVEQ